MLLIAVGLAMDAFAVSVGKGLNIQGQCKKACIVTGLYFGAFCGAQRQLVRWPAAAKRR